MRSRTDGTAQIRIDLEGTSLSSVLAGVERSVFAVILFHAIGNVWRSAFPGGRVAYELCDRVVGYGIIVLVALVVALRWEPNVPMAQR